MPTDAAVIGGGPAGLAAAEVLAEGGLRVTVYDRMPGVGRKFLLAGRGGLNLTHAEPLERLLARYGDRPVLRDAVRSYPPAALRAWCEALGQPTIVGSSNRVFPAAWKSAPLLRAWLGRLGALGVAVRPGHRWTGFAREALRFETATGAVLVRPAFAVLAMGGASWPRMGSDGAWVPALRAAGVPVAPLRPANMGLRVDWSDVFRARFAGSPLKRVAARVGAVTIRGEAIVTHEGIEGGVVYALGAALRDALDEGGAATLTLDLRPDLDLASLSARLGGPGVSTANALRRAGLSPAAAALVREVAAPGSLADRVKALSLRIVGVQGLDRAISTAGGVSFAALDGWRLRARPDVFLAGEMLDWEAPTGGYLLQACISTGRAAAVQALLNTTSHSR